MHAAKSAGSTDRHVQRQHRPLSEPSTGYCGPDTFRERRAQAAAGKIYPGSAVEQKRPRATKAAKGQTLQGAPQAAVGHTRPEAARAAIHVYRDTSRQKM
jgi:hypothetical protein